MKWKKIASQYISDHIYFTARKDICVRPDGKIVDPYFVVELPPCVCIMALTEEEQVLLVRQYRYPIDAVTVELPGGFVDKDEEPVTAAARELQEETGYHFSSFELLAKVAANPGVLNNFTYLFLAKGGRKVSSQELDANEEIELLQCSLDEIRRMLEANEIVQALHVSCLYYGLKKLGLNY